MKLAITSLALAALVALGGCGRSDTLAAPVAQTPAGPEAAPHKLRFLLNSGFSGANAWFLVAQERGYFREEGIEIEFVPGRGAFTAAGRMVEEHFDVGYGDIQATYEQAAKLPGNAPVGVYMVMDRSPSVIILPASSPVTTAPQLAGKTITGHGTDVALNTFEQYAFRTGLDPTSVKIVANDGNWKVLIGLLDEHRSDALFGYLSTSSAAIHTAGGKVDERLRFLKFRDAVPELYGSALMVSPTLLREQPEVARGLVRAVNRGVMETLCEPKAAIDLLVARDPKQDAGVELGRLMDTVEDMGGAEWIVKHGVGDIDPERMRAGIQLTHAQRKLSRLPSLDEVFDAALLPDIGERTPCAQEAGAYQAGI
ncbi:hypothetical protein ABB26_00475 [Stenotrophomonas humi]|uniref:SsuA/THI5-like domain-containing protein n=1 Tax=Stenotrophomonas humi TaxID=405444 RepID=A0A0R0CMT2_9GAMM|nr:ABC transporter substrate-binding protein [Stenotrophomonas humi]KRG66371.1 hypothetical protein ABB26_00475 [Stenotrophomonas humi]